MSATLDTSDEILQDFLVEAGEILELLGEQLVDLEKEPEDMDLLNAVFRGFHTVKGGAGFLALDAMVSICHIAEDVFNILRNGEMILTPDMMDQFLKVLDVLHEQFDEINEGQMPAEADSALLAALTAIKNGETENLASETAAEVTPPDDQVDEELEQMIAEIEEPAEASGDITDVEFESLLDNLHGKGKGPTAKTGKTDSEEITDGEFDNLLDQLHGKGKGPTATPAKADESKSSEDITDEEFEALLDQIHGEGKGPVISKTTSSPVEQNGVAEKKPVKKKKASKKTESKPAEKTEKAEKPAAKKPVATKSPAKPVDTTVRVDTKRLDDIMNMVGELVLVRNRLDNLEASLGNEDITKAVSNLDVVTSDLQTAVMKTRMQPIKKVFGRFPRVVRDLARSLDKEIELVMVGEDTDLDKNLVEELADPLIHLVRNSVDHGIEMPDDREKAGKPRTGKITLVASQEGDHIQLIIEDDGGGMDPDVLRNIAVEKGVMDEESAARLEDRECYALIFAPGFSTKKEISDVSGRGVGMDVVKTRISKLNGSVDIDSNKGIGTVITIKLPLTLAIMPTLMVRVGERMFAFPLTSVSEIFQLEEGTTNVVDGQLVIMVRNKAMPLLYLHEWLVTNPNVEVNTAEQQVVVAHVGNHRVGFVVNAVVGQEEVVIKPLGAVLRGLPGFAGATITGDGCIALILDVPSLMKARGKG
ncbi:MAG TPA: chemotaxis protein CheA [Gammaproteobacteria bacterium]|nr:chemotaxis protein CheA [Gammaproteobacteria bacterium]